MKKKLLSTLATTVGTVFLATGQLRGDDVSVGSSGRQADELSALKERVEHLERITMADDERALRPYWDGRLRMKSDDGRFNVQLRGRLHYDLVFWGREDSAISDSLGRLGDRTIFRRARLGTQGTLWGVLDYKAEWDFAGGDASRKDLYMKYNDLGPLGSLTIGHVKEPFSLEELTSSNSVTFMERSLPTQFAPNHNLGFLLQDQIFDKRVTWALGVFDQDDDNSHGDWAVTGRVTGTPLYLDDGNQLVHLGIAASRRGSGSDDRMTRYRARPEIRSNDRFVNTGWLPQSGSTDMIGFEAAKKWGPASIQGEYIVAKPRLEGQSNPTFDGYYISASYVLTGESRGYSGTFGGVKPRRNAFEEGGIGAWEIAARYSNIDLDSNEVRGGKLNNITAGLNWYLNPSARMMINYVNTKVQRDDFDVSSARADAVTMRFQVSF